MTKEQKFWLKSLIFIVGILFWIYALVNLIDCTTILNSLSPETPNAIKNIFIITAVFGWLIFLLTIIVALTSFIFSFFKQKELKNLNGILLIVLVVLLLSTLIIILGLYFATHVDIKNLTNSSTNELLSMTLIASCINVFSLIIPSIITFIISSVISNIDKNSPIIDNEEKSVKEENPEKMAQQLIENKIKETEEKLKTKEMELRYREVLKRLNDIEKEEKVEKPKVQKSKIENK